jgi:hypothetical protein
LAGLTVAKLLTDLDGAANKIKGLSKGLTVGSIAIAVGAIVWDLTGAYLESGSWLDWLAALGTTAIGTGLAYKFGGKGGAGFTLLVSGVAMLGRLVFDLSEGNVDFGDSQTWITTITGGIETAVGGVITWKVFGPKIIAWVKGLFASQNLATIGTTIGGALSKGWTAITGALASIPVWGWIAAAVLALIGGVIALGASDFDFSEVGRKVGKAIGDALLAVIKWVDAASDWVSEVGKAIKDGFSAAIDWVVKNFSSKEAFLLMLHDMTVAIALGVNDFVEAGRNLVKGLWKGVTDWWENLKSNIKEFCDGFVKGFLEAFGIHSPATTMIPVGKYLVEGIWSGITGAFNWIVTKVKTWAADLIKKITDSMKPSAISEKLSTMWTNAKNWWNKSKTALATYTPNIGDIKSKLSSAWTTARNWWIKSKAAMSTYTPSIGSIKDRLVSAWNTAKTWWNKNVKLSIPSLSFKVTYTTKGLNTVQKAIVNALGMSGWPKLSFAASGGIFDTGSLVWAGESGPEVLANAGGGKTGVMNVQQMSEAVYEGVYSAVVAAMRANGGNSGGALSVNVYLDGKQITSSVEQRQKERGAPLMGSQVYAY